jgi:hypothetical protein
MPKLKHLGGNTCRTDAIAIELHDDTGFGDARKLFAEAIHNEPTICRRPLEPVLAHAPGSILVAC